MNRIFILILLLAISSSVYADSNLINGKVPPGNPTSPSFVKEVLSSGQSNFTLKTIRSVYNFNARSKVRIFQHPGQTCVLDGEMTLYADGDEPIIAGTGNCYLIPAGRNVSEVNTAQQPTSMLSSFIIPVSK